MVGKFTQTILAPLSILLLQAGCGAVFVNEGSKDAALTQGLVNADANKPKANVPAGANIITNFEDGSKNINAKLFGGSGGAWSTITFGGNSISGEFVAAGGANGTSKCAHVTGNLTDNGDFVYPAFTLEGDFRKGGFYDASAFNGIRFYYKCPSDDQAIKRRFGVGTAATLPAQNGGTCQTDCYNHFGAFMDPANDWVQRSYTWDDLKRESGWGSPVTPPDLADHLKEFIYIKWDHSGDNHAGTYKIDYWVDEVEFF